MQSEKLRYTEVDSLKGLAMFLVILGHAIILYPVNLHENAACLWLFRFAGSIHVMLFFLLSGFLFSYNGDSPSFLRKRFLRLGIPYLIFSLADMLPRAFLASFFNRPRSLSESLLSLVFNGGEFWFLRALFLLNLLFIPLSLLQKRSILWRIAVECLLFVVAVYPWAKLDWYQFLDLDRLRLYPFFFNTGLLLRRRYPAVKGRLEAMKPFPLALTSLLLTALWVLDVTFVRLPSWQAWVLLIATGLLGIAAVYTYTAWRPFNVFFSRFGPWTLQLYLLNGWTLGASRYFICNILGITVPAVIIIFNVAVDFYFSYFLIKYVFARFRVLRFAMGIPETLRPAPVSVGHR